MPEQNSSPITRRDFLKAAAIGSTTLSVSSYADQLISKTAKKPNILFLMADQYRGDCLGCMGNSVIKTPNLDAIAKDGAVFTNAYTSLPSCTPARASILTGLSPWHHGMLGYSRVAKKYPFEMPHALRDAGYYTFGIGKMHFNPQRNTHGYHKTLLDESSRGIRQGFVSDYRKWFKQQAPDLNPDVTGIGFNDYRSGVYALPEELHPTTWTADRAVNFIEKYKKTQPFLLKVSFARPHSPYDPPKRFWDMYRDNDMPNPSVGDWAQKFAPHAEPPKNGLWYGDLGAAQARRSRHGYYGSVTFIDEQIGRIISTLKKQGLYENTLIIFFADHGDMLGDHHHWRKTYAYEASAHIPMLLRWPKTIAPNNRRGIKLSNPVELRDVLPTFLDAAGAQIPNHLDGQSMLNLVRGRTKNWRKFIDLEHDTCYTQTNHWNALTDESTKYIYHAYYGTEQLFDLKKDPHETCDLASNPAHFDRLKFWRQRLIEHFAERGPAFVSNGQLIPRPKRMLHSPFYPDLPNPKKYPPT